MILDGLKSGMDQLSDLVPDQSSHANDHQEHTDWAGWDSWVNVAENQKSASRKRRNKRAPISIRPGSASDLEAANRVIEACVMTWNIPERVKRLSLASYRYTEIDLEHLRLLIAQDHNKKIIGVAGIEPAEKSAVPAGKSGLLLHGIYVEPKLHRSGTGRQLVKRALEIAKAESYAGLLIRAQPDAIGFFKAIGSREITTANSRKDYPHQYWLEV